MKYFAYNQDGTFNGLWDSEFHNESEIPESKIKITKELQEHIRKINGLVKIKDVNQLDASKAYDIGDYANVFEAYKINSPMPKTDIELLKEENLQLKVAIAEESEAKDAEILQLKLAIAELAEGGVM